MGSGRSVVSVTNRWTVAAAAVVMQSGFGSLYAWSVFRQPLSAHYGANITDVNIAFFVASLVFATSTFGAGFLLRRVGPRFVGIAGGVLFGLGIFLAAFTGESLLLLYLTYGLVAAVGGGFGLIAPIVVLPRWFPDRPGLAYALALVGFGLGTMVSVPVISALLSVTGGPFRTFGVLGISYAVLLGSAAWFVRYPSEDGNAVPGSGESGLLQEREQVRKKGSYDLRQALRTWQWYAIWVMFFLNTTVGLAIYSDARAMAGSISGTSAALASAFVVIISMSDTVGRLVWPILSDRIGGRNVFLVMFLLQALAFLLMPSLGAESFVVLCVLASAVTSCFGGGYATMSALSTAYYGLRDIGAIYGSIVLASGIAGFGAPVLLARSADLTGSYDLALYITGGLMLIGTTIPLALRPPVSSRGSG
ncbi:MAG TPA: MFS transporter [Rubrobacter sp.]|nr:MFS transporter [Rubrobacter sp.]